MKLALIFPGIGYHEDKPLLYYARKIAAKYDYEIRCVHYPTFAGNIKGDAVKMREFADLALQKAEEDLRELDLTQYEEVLLVGKSIGTAVAGAFAQAHELQARCVLYTPLEMTFTYDFRDCIAFTGTADPWVDPERLRTICERQGIDLRRIAEANHSLETGDVLTDLANLTRIMEETENYVEISDNF